MSQNRFVLALFLLTENWKPILLFEILYKLMAWMLCSPLLFMLFKWSLQLSGYSFVTLDNLKSYLLFPTTFVFLLLILSVVILFSILEVTALVHGFHASFHQKKVTCVELFQKGSQTAMRMFGRKNIFNLFLALLLLPLAGSVWSSELFPIVILPEFIVDYIASSSILATTTTFVGLGCMILLVRWMYSIHCFVLLEMSVGQALKESAMISKRKFFRNVFFITSWNIAVVLILLILPCIALAGILLIIKTQSVLFVIPTVLLAIVSILLAVLAWIFALPIEFSIISAMFYNCQHVQRKSTEPYKSTSKRVLKVTKIAIAFLLVISMSGSVMLNSIEKIKDTIMPISTEITAHRGHTLSAVENTLPSFEAAIEANIDFIELDVQPTKDGIPVVFHDETLKRLTKSQGKVSELTYAQLREVKFLGSSDTYIPTLQEVLDLCKGKIKLNIELKCFDADFIAKIVAMLECNNMLQRCVITSLNYDALKLCKEQNRSIKTGYVTALAYGEISRMEYADIFSVEASFVTKDLVEGVHIAGKQVYVWTVNRESEMERILSLGVDNLVTDFPVTASAKKLNLVKVHPAGE